MNRKIVRLLSVLLLWIYTSQAQSLQPGFDKTEYTNCLMMAFGKYDSMIKLSPSPLPNNYHMLYNSKVVGLDNRWNLWLREDKNVAVINIRGTVSSTASWLANIYSAMVPATGHMSLNDSTTFDYQLATNESAAVHVGWLIALSYLAPDIEEKIKEQYSAGVKEFIIMGHSQGAAIAFLLRSYLYYQTKRGKLPAGITFKTYCSAAPKPGNLYYGYDFEYINRNGWAFTVVNAADWVPETPISIQQLADLNKLNPFVDIKKSLRKQNYLVRLYAGLVYKKLNRATRKATAQYEKYLGDKIGKQVRKVLPSLKSPPFTHSMHYERAGTPVILMPDSRYFQVFPDTADNPLGVWIHHGFNAYYFLITHYEPAVQP